MKMYNMLKKKILFSSTFNVKFSRLKYANFDNLKNYQLI